MWCWAAHLVHTNHLFSNSQRMYVNGLWNISGVCALSEATDMNMNVRMHQLGLTMKKHKTINQ